MPQVKCPRCGNRHLQVAVTMLAEVRFDLDGEHDVLGVDGGIEFDSESDVICATNLGGCGHSGTLKEFTQ